jgi:hypothetical protein
MLLDPRRIFVLSAVCELEADLQQIVEKSGRAMVANCDYRAILS